MASEETSTETHIKALEQDSKKHREAFEHELSVLLHKAKKIAGVAAAVGGGFALTYYVTRQLTGGKKTTSKKDRPVKTRNLVVQKKASVFSSVGNVVLTEIAVFLLAIAKERIKAYLDDLHPRHEHSKNA